MTQKPSDVTGGMRWPVGLVVVLLACIVGLAAGCAGTGDGDDSAPSMEPPADRIDDGQTDIDDAEFEAPECSEFMTWRDAQDALELDDGHAPYLGADGDGGACQELAQTEYENGWGTGYPEGSASIFFESPDGYLYSSGIQYESFDCESADPGPGEWDFATTLSEEPEADGAHDGWEAACATTFENVVGDDLYWGDDEVWVTQTDCEVANAY